MMSLGQFVFSLGTLSFDELRRQSQWRHPSNARVGLRPARQYVGPGEDSLSLSGLLVPEFMGSRLAMDELRKMADSGQAYALADRAGDIHGAWVIESVNETATLFVAQGVPRRVQFELSLARVEDHLADPAGGASPGEVWPIDWWF